MKRLPAALAISLTFSACSGPDSDLPSPYRSIDVPSERLRSPEAIARGEELFEKNCALCHGEKGDGHGRRSAGFKKKPPRLADPAWRRRTSPRHVFYTIREGVQGTPMPSWSWLSEEESWDLVAYVLALSEGTPSRRQPSTAPL
jgi:mono/diheme cytochrome c family protein